jgi:hypothetical protein
MKSRTGGPLNSIGQAAILAVTGLSNDCQFQRFPFGRAPVDIDIISSPLLLQ